MMLLVSDDLLKQSAYQTLSVRLGHYCLIFGHSTQLFSAEHTVKCLLSTRQQKDTVSDKPMNIMEHLGAKKADISLKS